MHRLLYQLRLVSAAAWISKRSRLTCEIRPFGCGLSRVIKSQMPKLGDM